MIFRQITHDDLGCASYLVGDEEAGVAAVVDPGFEVDEYLELARYLGVDIEHVLETHNHADHVSGHGRLAAATGATIHVHRSAAPAYDHEPLDDGDELVLGSLVIRALHTPGHRPEHTAFALVDTRRGEDPWAVLTGDTLFVGDVARPDLAVEASDGARAIFRSLHEKLLCLAPAVEVWPAHLGGSMCGGPGMDLKPSSTIGFEAAHNPTLAILDEERFVAVALAGLGPQPPHFEDVVALNTGPLLTAGVELLPLAPRQVDQRRAAGALLVDVRTDQQFDDAHVPGAVCDPMLRAGFGSRLAWLTDLDQEVVFVGRDDEDGRRAGRLAVAVGVRRLAGYLHGGMTSWWQEGRAVAHVERLRARRPRGPSRGRAGPPAARRPRALGVGRRPHPGLRVAAVARRGRRPGRPRPVPAHRRPLRVGSACRGGREPAAARRRRGGRARRRRGRPGLGPARSRARARAAGRRAPRPERRPRRRASGRAALALVRGGAEHRRGEAVDRRPELVVRRSALVAPALVVERRRQQDLAQVVHERRVEGALRRRLGHAVGNPLGHWRRTTRLRGRPTHGAGSRCEADAPARRCGRLRCLIRFG